MVKVKVLGDVELAAAGNVPLNVFYWQDSSFLEAKNAKRAGALFVGLRLMGG